MDDPHYLVGSAVHDAPAGDDVDPKLLCRNQSIHTIMDAEYWTRLCPWLSVEGDTMLDIYDEGEPFPMSLDEGDGLRARMQRDGYYVVKPQWPEGMVEGLKRGMAQLIKYGWHPTFISVYDEAWAIPFLMREVISEGCGGDMAFNDDWLGYFIDHGEAGMPPHRDHPVDSDASWFDEERTLPRIATAWVALSEANATNSCLYFLPAAKDALYHTKRSEEAPEVFASPYTFQDVVCVPLAPGEVVVFSHRVYHWGSASTPQAAEPRVSVAFGFSDPAFKPRYLSDDAVGGSFFPAASHRVALCAAQMLIYNKRHNGPWPLTSNITDDLTSLSRLLAVFELMAPELHARYVKTVRDSPVMPMLKEVLARQRAGGSNAIIDADAT